MLKSTFIVNHDLNMVFQFNHFSKKKECRIQVDEVQNFEFWTNNRCQLSMQDVTSYRYRVNECLVITIRNTKNYSNRSFVIKKCTKWCRHVKKILSIWRKSILHIHVSSYPIGMVTVAKYQFFVTFLRLLTFLLIFW